MKYLYPLWLLLLLAPEPIFAQTAKAHTQQQRSLVAATPAPTAPVAQLADSSRARELSYYKKMYELADKSDAFAKGAVGISLTIAGLILGAQFIYTIVLYKRQLKSLKKKFSREVTGLQQSITTLEGSVSRLEGEIRELAKESDFNKLRRSAEMMLQRCNYEAALPQFIEVANQSYERGESSFQFLKPIHEILKIAGSIEEEPAAALEALMNKKEKNSLVKSMMQHALDSVSVIRKNYASNGTYTIETIREVKKA
jgi:TolA-binding protein